MKTGRSGKEEFYRNQSGLNLSQMRNNAVPYCRKERDMISKKMEEALSKQVNEELFSAYLYLSMSAWFQHNGWNGMAVWMKKQAGEEMAHAKKIYDFVFERGGNVELFAIKQPQAEWASPMVIFQEALKHEKFITDCINNLVKMAKDENDNASEVMLGWFVSEQVEEEGSVMKVVKMMEKAGDSNPALLILDSKLGQRE